MQLLHRWRNAGSGKRMGILEPAPYKLLYMEEIKHLMDMIEPVLHHDVGTVAGGD